MTDDVTPLYSRVLLKLSGEALQGEQAFGIDSQVLARIVDDVVTLVELGIEVAIVIGAGNFCRGRDATTSGLDFITADQMGMLATVMNALPLRDAFLQREIPAQIMSAVAIPGVVPGFIAQQAMDSLTQGEVVIFAGGTGNPLVTTDSAASLRSIEIGADVLLKATNVDGVYSADPAIDPTATRYQRLSYNQALAEELAVLDLTAFYQCRQYSMPIRVFNIHTPGALLKVIYDESEGTLIEGDQSHD